MSRQKQAIGGSDGTYREHPASKNAKVTEILPKTNTKIEAHAELYINV